jgi:hypothetical protein
VTANASQAVCKHFLFLCLLTPFSQRQRLRQLCSFAIYFFLIDENIEDVFKAQYWVLKTAAAPMKDF